MAAKPRVVMVSGWMRDQSSAIFCCCRAASRTRASVASAEIPGVGSAFGSIATQLPQSRPRGLPRLNRQESDRPPCNADSAGRLRCCVATTQCRRRGCPWGKSFRRARLKIGRVAFRRETAQWDFGENQALPSQSLHHTAICGSGRNRGSQLSGVGELTRHPTLVFFVGFRRLGGLPSGRINVGRCNS